MKRLIFSALSVFLLTSCHESMEDRAAREAKEFTRKNCPMTISEYVVNDSVTYEQSTRTIHYYFTLKGGADTSAIYTPDMKATHVKIVKDAMQLKIYKEHKFNFAYTYFSAKHKGKALIDIKITPKDYQTANMKSDKR